MVRVNEAKDNTKCDELPLLPNKQFIHFLITLKRAIVSAIINRTCCSATNPTRGEGFVRVSINKSIRILPRTQTEWII